MRLKYFRTCEDVQKDLIMPFLGLGLCDQPFETEVRMTAVMEVLRRLPEKDYRTLKRKADDDEFQWFIPFYEDLGGVFPFPANVFNEKDGEWELKPYAKVIILGPRLEEIDFDIAVAVAAHELAHIFLGHKTRPDSETDEIQEKAAWNKVIEWGFTKEEKKHRSFILEAMKNDKRELAMLEKKQKEAEAKKKRDMM